MTTTSEQLEICDQLLETLDQAAELVRQLGNEPLERYVLAEFEGQGGGWLGEFARDKIERYRDALQDAEYAEDDEEGA